MARAEPRRTDDGRRDGPAPLHRLAVPLGRRSGTGAPHHRGGRDPCNRGCATRVAEVRALRGPSMRRGASQVLARWGGPTARQGGLPRTPRAVAGCLGGDVSGVAGCEGRDELREALGLILRHEGAAVVDDLEPRPGEARRETAGEAEREEAVVARPGEEDGAIEGRETTRGVECVPG